MKKLILCLLLFFSTLFAKENYSEMSTQELISIIGFVKSENSDKFLKELNSRIPKMTQYEKALYEKRLTQEIKKEEHLEDEK